MAASCVRTEREEGSRKASFSSDEKPFSERDAEKSRDHSYSKKARRRQKLEMPKTVLDN